MEIKVFKNDEEIAEKAAGDIISLVNSKNNPVIGFATGASPVSTYKRIIKAYNEGKVSFKNVTSFNLDEYCTIPKSDKNSYYTFMHENLFDKIDIDEKNINIPDGNPANVEEFCNGYDKKIAEKGGIDIQILGIGRNGHIGFNEPSDIFTEQTYKVKLTESTVEANDKYFGSASLMPKEAITMGIGSIMKSKTIILIACGIEKAEAVRDMIKGNVTPECPASILQKHSDARIYLDEDAASLL